MQYKDYHWTNLVLYFHRISDLCVYISESWWFTSFITFVIIVACFQVGFETSESWSKTFSAELQSLNWYILYIFTLECVVHVLAEDLHPWLYLKNPWNVFDLAIVVTSWSPIGGGSLVMILRLLRLMRILKLMHAFPKLQVIIEALFKGLGSILYIRILLIIFFYLYAIIGITLFSENDPWHFGTLHSAFFALFQCVTLDNWVILLNINLYGCENTFYNQNPYLSSLCVNSQQNFIFSYFFFTSFILLGSLVLLTLFIGVIGNILPTLLFLHISWS